MDDLKEILAAATDLLEILANYRVEKDGRVFSVAHNWRGLGEREITQIINSHGYPSVRLSHQGRRHHIPVHRLVAAVHLPPRPSPYHEIRHLDGDRSNSASINLAWGTRSENAKDRVRHGTDAAPRNGKKAAVKLRGERSSAAKLSNADACEIQRRFDDGETAYRIARDYQHVSYWAVNNAARRKTFSNFDEVINEY